MLTRQNFVWFVHIAERIGGKLAVLFFFAIVNLIANLITLPILKFPVVGLQL